jgi:hypothetical protein
VCARARSLQLEQYRKVENKCPEEVASVALGCPSINMPYIKKWVRTRHAVLFRLSNRTVQVSTAHAIAAFYARAPGVLLTSLRWRR